MKFGIKMLDEKVGEIPPDSKVLLICSPEIDPAPFGLSMLVSNLDCYEGIYITNNKPLESLRSEADSLGLDLRAFEENEKVKLLDAFSNYIGIPAEERFIVDDPFNPSSFIDSVRSIKGENSIVVWDSISSYIDIKGDGIDDVLKINAGISEGATLIALFSAWGYDDLEKLKKNFDTVLSLRSVEETILRQFIFAEKVRGEKARVAVPVKVLRPGGVKVYFPKIVVTGPYNAGKSTLVKGISTASVSVDRMGTTVALDHGYLDYKGFTADLYGTPGQECFDPILSYLADEAVAVILVIDATAPETFARAREMLEKANALLLPLIIAANHYDRENPLSVEEIRESLGVDESIAIIPTVATAKKGLSDLLDALIEKLMG